MTFEEITKRRRELLAEISSRKADHDEWLKAAKRELESLSDNEHLLVGGIDLDRLRRGKGVVFVQGNVGKSRPRQDVVRDAKEDIASGGNKLVAEYFGVKNYASFGDQRADCRYGMGPRHGTIVFSIGLAKAVLYRMRDGGALTNAETEDALYYLAALPQIEQSLKAAS